MTSAPLPRPRFDFRAPDYTAEFRWRLDLLARLRSDTGRLAAFRAHYAEHPADFIDDWGVTFDPRNLNARRPALVPFRLFPKQRELISDLYDAWRNREPLLIEKSRDCGASWVTIGFAVAIATHHRDFVAGFGSRKVELVDKLGDPDALFTKARMFTKLLPAEFRAGWTERDHGHHLKLIFPHTGSVLKGEGGDNIGRGGRTSVYFVDESAHLPRAQLVEASLAATTDCRVDLSSINGMSNVFAEKRHSGRVNVFIFDWRDDPRKDQAWYDAQCARLDPIVVAQEIDRNYSASVDRIVIPAALINSAIDAHIKLGIKPVGAKRAALDVADIGKDKNAFAGGHGIVLRELTEWRGKDSDMFETTQHAFALCDAGGYESMRYDSAGLGAGVRGDARVINEGRANKLTVEGWNGGGAVVNPGAPIPSLEPSNESRAPRLESVRTNEDFFANAKAQGWWWLRTLFMRTHRAVTEGAPYDPAEIISISSELPMLAKLKGELSRPTWTTNSAGQIVIDKMPDGTPSPNLADAVMILYAPRERKRGGLHNLSR